MADQNAWDKQHRKFEAQKKLYADKLNTIQAQQGGIASVPSGSNVVPINISASVEGLKGSFEELAKAINGSTKQSATEILFEEFLLKRDTLFDNEADAAQFVERLMLIKEAVALQKAELHVSESRIAIIERELTRGTTYLDDHESGERVVSER